jgi:hypothetical protein
MNDPAAENRVEALAAFFREVVPLDDSAFPQHLDESAHSGMETGPAQEPGPEVQARHPFEVYVTGYTSEAQTTATVLVARGDVVKTEDDANSVATISGIDDPQTLTSGECLWLQTVFTPGGSVSSITVMKGTAWSFAPALYRDYGTSGNEWITLLCQVRASKKGKSGGAHPDSGEFPEIKADFKIAQKTHTHLAVARLCVGASRKLLWGLVPSSGGLG